jgi:hypothetical protein
MTMANLFFSIDTVNSRIYVNNISYPLTSNTLATNVSMIRYSTQDGGSIIYNDRPPLPDQFSDPSPYQPYINAWLTAASSDNPALTLEQAQAIKNGLIDGIWSVKRQANVSVATSLGTYSFDSSDDDLSGALNSASWMPAVANIIGSPSGVIASLVNSINSVIVGGINDTVVAGINSELNVAATDVGNIANVTNANLSGITGELNQVISAVNNFDSTIIPISNYTPMGGAGFSGGVGGICQVSAAAGTSLTASVKMLPVGSTTYPAFTLADQFAVVTAIQTQRANEAAVRAVKQAVVDALSTISAVIAYDATTGW